MTDQVLSRAAIVASLATNTDGNITAQTLRNWLMSSPLNTECVLLTGGSTIAGSVTATTFALGNGANFIASTGGFEAGGVLVQNNTNPIFQVDGGGNVTFYGGV